MKVFIIGSVSQEDDISAYANFVRDIGYEVDHVRKQPDKNLGDLITEAYQKINDADKIIVFRKPDGSIGTGTLYEMKFAEFLGKNILKVMFERGDE